jgi:hypothetical protein
MVTVSNCGDMQPLLFTVQGTQTGTYWDESLRVLVPFGSSQALHAVVVPDAPNQQTLYRNVGITPLTEAVYQYLNASAGAFGWTVAANVKAANSAIAGQINQVLPPSLQLQGTDITRLAAVARDATSQVFGGSTPNLTYGLVIGGMAQAAGVHNAQSIHPGLDLLGQLAADLSDGDLDGAKNGTAVAPSPTQAAYNLPTMTADTLGGIATLAQANGRAVSAATYRAYNLGGTISGLTAGVLELADGPSTLVVSAPATSFAFGGVLTGGAPYAIRVQTQPVGLTCSLANGAGSAGSADVTNVAVTCSNQSYTVGGTISGLTQPGLVLANGADVITVPANATTFTMPQLVAFGGGYAVAVQAQPAGEACSVANGTGTMAAANVTNVAVTCLASDYTLSGTIQGLTSSGLVLANGGATVSPGVNAQSFTFGAVLTVGSKYAVSVQMQPTGLTCSVANGSGTAGAANVSNVVVTCSSQSYTLGGTISGLTAGGLVLSNGTDTVSPPANATAFTFGQKVAYTSGYAVGVSTQPTGLTCSVANGKGTMPAGNVSNVQVSCSAQAQAYTVGGSISGLTQGGLVLANGADTLSVPANAPSFQMNQSVVSGSAYDVTVQTQPTGENCGVANGSGTVNSAKVTNVTVTCSLQSYTLGGSISGLNASGLVLSNGTDTVSPSATATSFTFGQKVTYGSAYAVTVQTQPSGETCSVTTGTGSGTMPAADVGNVAVRCTGPASYTVGGSVSGLTGTGLVLANGADSLPVSSNGNFTMPMPVVSGNLYSVKVQTQPTGETCAVANGTNTMPAANVNNVAVTCTAQAYSVGGTISGLNAGGLLVVSDLVLANDDNGETLTVPFLATSFVFQNLVANGSGYSVVVRSQPSLLGVIQLTCSVSKGSGVMGTSNVTNVAVSCL